MTGESNTSRQWVRVISPVPGKFNLKAGELWHSRDLIVLLVKRDFIALYKQTILGPAWHFIQPLFITIIFTLVFGKIAGISTEGIPPFLFYMSGTIIWTYFSVVMTGTANTFVDNSRIFGKVYFPRLVVPIAKSISNLIAFTIQFLFFVCFILYFQFRNPVLTPNMWILATPILLVMTAGFALGLGAIISSLTTRYRDLAVLVGFGVQLMMYATPVIYPLSIVPEPWRRVILLNPLAPVVELFRHAFLGASAVSSGMLIYSFLSITVIFITGVVLFNRVERNFVDTI